MSMAAAASAPPSVTSRIGVAAGMIATFGPLLGWIAFAVLLILRGPDSGTVDALGSLLFLAWVALGLLGVFAWLVALGSGIAERKRTRRPLVWAGIAAASWVLEWLLLVVGFGVWAFSGPWFYLAG